MSTLIPSTPTSQTIRKYITPQFSKQPSNQTSHLAQNIPLPPSPGTWRHPKLDEITRRQHLTTFSDNNLQRILTNSFLLILTFLGPSFLIPYLPFSLSPSITPYTTYLLLSLRLLLLYNILVGLSPLYLPSPSFTDIPLTPTQRSLLNLPPAASTPPGSAYITPPRYPRSASGSPLSNSQTKRKESPGSFGKSKMGDSAFAPSTPSPLWQKAVEGRRGSFGNGSPLGKNAVGALGGSVFGAGSVLGKSGTPSPSQMGRGSSVGLNSKWLYERGRASFGDRTVYS